MKDVRTASQLVDEWEVKVGTLNKQHGSLVGLAANGVLAEHRAGRDENDVDAGHGLKQGPIQPLEGPHQADVEQPEPFGHPDSNGHRQREYA